MTIFRSWKRMLVGAAAGLGITSLALLLTTILTFQIEFNEQSVAFVAYVMLVYGTVFGAAVALLTRPSSKEESDAQASPDAFSDRSADRVLRLVGDSTAREDERDGEADAGSDDLRRREVPAAPEDLPHDGGSQLEPRTVDEGIVEAMDAVAKARLHRASEQN